MSGLRTAIANVRRAWAEASRESRAFVILCLLFANFAWYGSEVSAAGGATAIGGRLTGGLFYLGRDGIFTEVGPGVWLWSLLHAGVTLVSLPVIAAMLVWLAVRQAPDVERRLGRRWDAKARLAAVIGSGDPTATGSPRLRIGSTWYKAGSVSLTCYPAGITVEAPPIGLLAIHGSDAVSVESTTLPEPCLVIGHIVPEIRSPIAVATPAHGVLRSAIVASLRPDSGPAKSERGPGS